MPQRERNPYRPHEKRSGRRAFHYSGKLRSEQIVNVPPIFKPKSKTETIERSLEAEIAPPKPFDILKFKGKVAKTTTTESKAA